MQGRLGASEFSTTFLVSRFLFLQPLRGLLPRAHTSFPRPRRLIPLHVQSPAFFSIKPDPDPTTSLPAAATQNREARMALQDEPELVRPLVQSPLGDAHTIKDALELYRLSDWGFVLFRCTYRSQEKWEKFAALVQGHARDYFEEAGMMDVYARMRWTVFEDAAALDGADIVETNRRFVEWVDRGPGGRELAGSVFGRTMAETDTPRHIFFLHVDEESLESVVDDAKAREAGGYFCTVVRADNVVVAAIEWDRVKGVYCREGRELEEEDMWDLRKRVRIDDLVTLYASLQVSAYLWYGLLSFDDTGVYVP